MSKVMSVAETNDPISLYLSNSLAFFQSSCLKYNGAPIVFDNSKNLLHKFIYNHKKTDKTQNLNEIDKGVISSNNSANPSSDSVTDRPVGGPQVIQTTLTYQSYTDYQKNHKTLNKDLSSMIIFADFSCAPSNDISYLKSLKSFSKLTTLSLSSCGLKSLPSALSQPPKTLRNLDLSNNLLFEIAPKQKWENIEGLSLAGNAFESWPEAINPDRMPSLVYLSLACNKIALSPADERFFFPLLRFADFSFCTLIVFPAFLVRCSDLRVLNLRCNYQMTEFDWKLIEKMEKLLMIDLTGCEVPPKLSNCNLPSRLAVIISRKSKKKPQFKQESPLFVRK